MAGMRLSARTVPHGDDSSPPFGPEDVLLRAPAAADVHLPLLQWVGDGLAELLEALLLHTVLAGDEWSLHQRRSPGSDAVLHEIAPALGITSRASNVRNRQFPVHHAKASEIGGVMSTA